MPSLQLFQELRKEWPAVKAAKWAVMISLGGGAVLGFGAATLWWTGTVSVLRERVSYYQDRIGEQKQSDYTATGARIIFYGNDQLPKEDHVNNINTWYALFSPRIVITIKNSGGKLLPEKAVSPKTWTVFLLFEKPIKYRQLVVTFSGGVLPPYEVKQQSSRFAIISVSDDIPAGELYIYAKP